MMYRTDQVSNGVFYVMIKDRKDVQGNIDIKGDGIMNTTDAEKRKILHSMKGLIVSCQVVPEDPIYTDDMVVKMAEAAQWAGAVGIRANSPEQIRAIKKAVDLPVIGLYKIRRGDEEVFITPTLEAAKQVWEAGAEIIAMDCTDRMTKEGRRAWELVADVKREIPEAMIFADVSNYDEAKRAADLGVDIVAPTLFGYTEATKHFETQDMRAFAKMCRDLGSDVYMMMEGHINTPEEAVKCLYLGAHAVVVGSAITRPHLTAKRFADLISGYRE